MDERVNIIRGSGGFRTAGMRSQGFPELALESDDQSLAADANALLRHIIRYVSKGNVQIQSGETMAYGYWLIKFVLDSSGNVQLWEYAPDATEFLPGANLTLRYWHNQHEVCSQQSAEFSPPRPDRLVVFSEGVLEGDAVQAVRYPAPEHMSGWWLTTARYDGRVQSLRTEHMYRITAARPDLSPYIALPFGFRFSTVNGMNIRFDESVAKQLA